MTIRVARAEDAEGLVAVHGAAWDAALAPLVGRSLNELSPLEDRVERARAALAELPEDACAWVAEEDGEVVGMAIVSEAELRDLYVAPAAWGSGVAQELMGTALDWLQGRRAEAALLWVVEANARARRFYEREGWTADGETRASPLGPRELRYRRPIR
jgi:GNAT superfamily N-acetyltransferase